MNFSFVLRLIAVANVAGLGLMGGGCASLPSAGSDDRAERAQIEHRLDEILVAARTKDFKRLDSYHLYGPKFTKFSSSSPKRLDARATRKGEHDGLRSLRGLKMRAAALKIDVFGDVGIATFILEYRFERDGGTTQARERATLVFVKEGGVWKVAHEHLSAIKP